MKPTSRHNLPWTEKELACLHFHWGALPLPEIAKRLNRTPLGVEKKARDIGLGIPRQGLMTLREFEKHSGFSIPKIRAAMRILGIRAMRRYSACVGAQRSSAYALTEEERERLLAFMLKTPHAFRNMRGSGKTEAGVWGVGRKPHACLRCGTHERPHCAKGLCKPCYSSENKAKQKRKRQLAEVYRRNNPDGCPLGGT